MHPEDIRVLFSLVNVGTPGMIIYEPVKIATVAGKVYVEAHHDVYRSRPGASSEAYTTLRALRYPIDWNHVESVLQKRVGTAETVTGSGKHEELQSPLLP
jgi:L,D-transpeptidase ErfK/SrfK